MRHCTPTFLFLMLLFVFVGVAEAQIPMGRFSEAEDKEELRAARILQGPKDIYIVFEPNVIETLDYNGKNISLDSSIIKENVKYIFNRAASQYGYRDNLIFEQAAPKSSSKNQLSITYSLRSSDLPTTSKTIIFSALTFQVSFDCNTCRDAEEKLLVQKHLNQVTSRIKAKPFILTRDFARDFKVLNSGYYNPKPHELGYNTQYSLQKVGDSFEKGIDLQVKQLSSIITDGKLSWP